jgi:hypothetical protein
MLRLLQETEPAPRCRITCGLAIYSWIKHRPAPPLAPGAASILPLSGVPIVLDPRMPRGKWSYTENDVEVSSGQVGNGERVWYLPAADQFVTTEFGPLVEVLDSTEGVSGATSD